MTKELCLTTGNGESLRLVHDRLICRDSGGQALHRFNTIETAAVLTLCQLLFEKKIAEPYRCFIPGTDIIAAVIDSENDDVCLYFPQSQQIALNFSQAARLNIELSDNLGEDDHKKLTGRFRWDDKRRQMYDWTLGASAYNEQLNRKLTLPGGSGQRRETATTIVCDELRFTLVRDRLIVRHGDGSLLARYSPEETLDLLALLELTSQVNTGRPTGKSGHFTMIMDKKITPGGRWMLRFNVIGKPACWVSSQQRQALFEGMANHLGRIPFQAILVEAVAALNKTDQGEQS